MAEERLELSGGSHLQRGADGAVLLHYRDASYGAQDVVPVEIYPDIPQKNRSDARAFVETVMLRDYGTAKGKWPNLAREFLSVKPARKK